MTFAVRLTSRRVGRAFAQAEDRWTPERDAQVIATKGRYLAIWKLADAWNLNCATVLARWHLLRAG